MHRNWILNEVAMPKGQTSNCTSRNLGKQYPWAAPVTVEVTLKVIIHIFTFITNVDLTPPLNFALIFISFVDWMAFQKPSPRFSHPVEQLLWLILLILTEHTQLIFFFQLFSCYRVFISLAVKNTASLRTERVPR